MSRITSEDGRDLVDVAHVDLGVAENRFDGLRSSVEEALAELLETSTSEEGGEIHSLKESQISMTV